MSNIFYFDEVNAFGENTITPSENNDIIIPQNTTIIITKYIISPNSYNKLLIPYDSKLIFETTDTKLYIKDSIVIEGEVITTTNSEIINADISNNTKQYTYWHNLSSWHTFKVPTSGDDIIIKENTNLVITNRSVFNNEKFGKLKIPSTSTLIIDIKDFTLNVSEFIQNSNSGSVIFSSGSTIQVSTPTNAFINRYWHDPNSWNNEQIPETCDDVVIPPYTRMILHWKSNTFSNFFKSITVPETSQLVIDLVNFTLKAENFNIYGSIKLNEGSKLETLIIVYNFQISCTLNIYFTGTLYDSLKYSPNKQRTIFINMLMDYYKVSEEQVVYLSHSFINNTIIIQFRLKVNKEIEALQMVHLTKSTFNNDCCIKDDSNSTLIDYLVKASNNEFNSNLQTSEINNVNITSKAKIIPTETEKIPPKITVWTIFPSNKYQKTYYFDDPDAWTNNLVPQNGDDIIIPQNVIIQLTQYSILAERYNNLIIPNNSQLYFINNNIDLYVKKVDNRGLIRSSKNSSIILSDTKANPNIVYNWNDPVAWGGNNPPQPGEHIIIPENTHIIVTYQSGISEVGYKKLVIPSTSSLRFDVKYFHFYVQSTGIQGTFSLGEGNTLSLKPYVSLTRTYIPVYLDATGKTTNDTIDYDSCIKADYNFTLSAISTKALSIAKFIKYRTINGNTSFIYEPKQISIIEDSIKLDISSQNLFHVEQKFVSNYNTTTDTLSNLYIQYISDVLVGNPNSTQLISNSSQINSIIINSKIENQITTILKTGLDNVQYKMENIYLNSMFQQIQTEKPKRISHRKDFEIYYFPIYNGDDLSIFVKMQANMNLSSSSYQTLKNLYNNNNNPDAKNKIKFIDNGCIIQISPTIWRIFINLR